MDQLLRKNVKNEKTTYLAVQSKNAFTRSRTIQPVSLILVAALGNC
jgi:hypothetical protein